MFQRMGFEERERSERFRIMALVLMASERESFDLSGPLHLTSIDWENAHHRRSVAASLVQGVYIMERDRQESRLGDRSLGPPWWEFFSFKVLRSLVDDADSSIFGAVYEFRPSPSPGGWPGSLDRSPRYVVAFRGTLTKPGSLSRDVELDLHFLQHGLHRTTRFEIAMRAVRNTLAAVGGPTDVWLAGHSLGSAMALLSGKTLAKEVGSLLETFLFNPPFFSAPIERIKDKKIKHGIRFAASVLTAGLTIAMKATNNNNNNNNQRALSLSDEDDSFTVLSEWVPSLFVNPGDHICSEYVGYFEHRRNMEEIGAGAIERLATRNSIGGLLLKAIGRESEPMHLIPSANLIVNLTPARDLKEAHGIHQWWRDDLHLKSNVYRYR